MKYIGIKEAAKKWGITDRRIRILCQEGRIEGAIKLEWSWAIPENATKPADGRILRHFKNSIRLGSIDIDKLNKLQSKYNIREIDSSSDVFKDYAKNLFSFASLLDEREYTSEEIDIICSGEIVDSLSLEDHTLLVNFISIFSRMFISENEVSSSYLEELHYMLTLGLKEIGYGFRDGFSETALFGKDNLKITLQIESLFNQYDTEWKNLHPVFKGVILFSEIIRIKPFENYNYEIATLALSKILIDCNILPPSLDKSVIDEFNATLSLSMRRGNFQDIARLCERLIFKSYIVLEKI